MDNVLAVMMFLALVAVYTGLRYTHWKQKSLLDMYSIILTDEKYKVKGQWGR